MLLSGVEFDDELRMTKVKFYDFVRRNGRHGMFREIFYPRDDTVSMYFKTRSIGMRLINDSDRIKLANVWYRFFYYILEPINLPKDLKILIACFV